MRRLFYAMALAAPLALSANTPLPQSVTFKAHQAPCAASHFSGMMHKSSELKKAEDNTGIINTAPEGTREAFNRSGEGWHVPFYQAERTTYDYHGMELVSTSDGTVYMRNPQSHLVSDSYLVGVREGDKITFELPQPIYAGYSEWNDVHYTYYAVMLDYKPQTATTGTYVQADNQTLTFTKDSNGVWKQDGPADGSVIFGMVDHDGEWFGFGDWGLQYTPFTDEGNTPPAGLKTEQWAMKYSGTGHFVKVGIDGSDLWMQGLYPHCPEAWIKGEIKGGNVNFPCGQYLGMDKVDYQHNYFYGATRDLGVDPNTGKQAYVFHLTNNFNCEYDAEARTLKSDLYVDINAHPEKERSHDVYLAPAIEWQPEVVDLTPMKIDVQDFFSYDPSEGVGGILFDYNQYNTKGQLIDSNNLYYRIVVDEDYMEIDPADYQGVTEMMVDVPYWFTDYNDIFGRRVTHEFYFFVRDFDYLGIRSLYKDGDKEYLGNITSCYGAMPQVWIDEMNSVEDINTEADIVAETYISLSGARVATPEKGVYIRTVKYSDGSVKNFKVVK